MSGELFAQFMQQRGRRILESAGTLWYSTNARIYLRIPFYEPFDPPRAELAAMMHRAHIVGVRYPSLRRAGLPSGVYLFRQKHYDLSSIHQKQRPRVRRGLESCEVREVDETELLVQGLQCNLDTMERQNRFDGEFGEPNKWRGLVNAVKKCQGVRAIGAFTNQRLAAYAITCREDGWIQILHQMSRRDSLDQFPNHALTYTLTKSAAEDSRVEGICYGVVGLSSGDGLHEYKLRFGYYVQQQNSVFLLHPGIEKLLSNSVAIDAIGMLRRMRPRDQTIARVESVLTGARMARLGTSAIDHARTLQ